MKVLMLGWELPPHHVGGMGVVCHAMAREMAKSGADIDFIVPFDADFSEIDFMRVNPTYEGSPDIPVITQEDLHKVHATTYGKVDITKETSDRLGFKSLDEINSAYLAKVLHVAIKGEYDVLHAHDWMTMRAAIMAKQLTGMPLFVHIHATEFDRAGAADGEGGNPLIHQIEYEGLVMADRVFAISEWVKQMLIRRYAIDPEKIVVVHNAMDMHMEDESHLDNSFHYLEEMKRHGYKVVTSAGRLTIQKGITQLLEAAKKVVDHDPKVIFLIVGNGDQYHELIELAADYGISRNVIFTGFINGTGKQWRDAFRVADVFIMPSVSEPFGITPLEATGYGTPSIISHQSGVSEVMQHALKVDFWDIDRMADQILAVVENPSLAYEMWQNAFDQYKHTNWGPSTRRMQHEYRQALEAAS